MASKFQATVVSNEYINAVADSAETGKPIAYSGVVASSTVFTDEQLKTLDYAGAQSANKEVTSVVTSSYLKQGSNTIVIEVNLSNENLSNDFQWASVLIYATYNGKNILVAVLRLVTPELFPAYDGKSIVSVGVDLFISVDKTAAANISVNGAGYATMDTVNKLRNYVDNDFNATIIRSDKDGVLNGSYSFSKAINALAGINGALNTRTATFTDFADVASNMKVYAGNWIVDRTVIANAPQGLGASYIVTVVYGTWGKNGTIYISDYANDQFFYTSVDGIIKGWKKIADDKTLLHNTTDETADGIKTFIKQIIAQAGVKGNLQGNADTATKLATARKLGGQPFDGTSDVNLPGVNATGNQDTTGNAATASTAAGSDKLNTGRNISVTGDVTAPAQKFDGTKDVALAASLPTITRNDTSSSSSAGYGATINVIDSVITDNKGRITGLNVSKISIPAQQTTVTGNAGTATKLQTARKIGGVSFDGTQDIDLAGVNKIGNQDTTGKAASADVLNVRFGTFTDISVVKSDMIKYAGNWAVYSPSINGMPNIDFCVMEVLPYTDNKGAGIIKVSSTIRDSATYILTVRNGDSSSNWVKLADDSTVVHNTGQENVSGAKNFFDVLTALSGIKGDVTGSLKGNADTATKLVTSRKINGTLFDGTADITVDPSTRTIGTATDLFTLPNGFYLNAGVDSTNRPTGSTWFTVEVIQNATNGFMRLIDNGGRSFWTTKSGSYWSSWKQDADDSTVVHNYGDEFVGGTKIFTGTLVANNPIKGNTIRYNILDGYDLNGYKDTGDFVINGANNLVNYPDNASNYAVLHVEKVNIGTSIQTLTTVNNIIYTRIYGGDPASFGSWVSVADDKNVVHNWGNETVYGDKKLTGNTGLNTVTTTKQQDTKITVAGLNMHFIETSLGVNVLVIGTYNALADGVWKTIGSLPSNITLPLMPVVMNSSAAGGINGVSFREGFTIFIRFTETGSIDVRYTTFKANDNKQYTSTIVVDNSTNWIK